MKRKRLSYLDILCISLFAIHGLRVLPIAIFLFFVPVLNEGNYINGIREQLKNMIILKMSEGTEFIACEMSMICA
jgi:hypothetical protein